MVNAFFWDGCFTTDNQLSIGALDHYKYILTTQNYTFLLDLLYWKYISLTKL